MSQPQATPPSQAGSSQPSSPGPAVGAFPKFISESRILEPRAVNKADKSPPNASSSSPAVSNAGSSTASAAASVAAGTSTTASTASTAATASTSATPAATASTTTTATVSSSSGNGGSGKGAPPSPPPPLNLCIVINICHYITPLAKLIISAQPLESIASEIDREAFLALQTVLKQLDTGKNEPINIFPFLDKICHFMNTSLNDFEEMDISFVWDNVVKLITLVIPPLRALFLGRRSLSLDEHAWISLISRCIHAQFAYPVQSLEDFIKLTFNQQEGFYYNNVDAHHRHRSPLESIKNFNAIIMSRLPDVMAFAVESGHLPPSLRFLDALSKNPAKAKPPVCIKFPASFTLPAVSKDAKGSGEEDSCTYDLVSVVTLEGSNFDVAQAYYRYAQERSTQWFKGSGATHDVVDAVRAIDKNFLHATDSKKIHPRLLVYAKRGITQVMQNLQDYVTKGGQLRSLGDATFEAAETPEHYDEAKQYYEEAISYDESLRPVLQEKLDALDQIERNQKAQSYENQADQSLGKKRFKEACDLYKLAMRSAVPNSHIYNRIREKEDYMMRIISLEIANHLTEKGEECLKGGLYAQSRENFAQALKLNPTYVHLHSIISGIDKVITAQSSAQKVSEANQAMKVGRYKYANQLFLEAVALVPERESSLKSVLESLVVLMQGEDALMKQRSGLMALEDKKYSVAIQLITEAISLLPAESVTEHAFFLCDRALVYFEMKEYHTSIEDCHAALELRPELAIAYFRLGSAQFELELYDEALASYEKCLRNDPSMGDQVKVKVRQVNTAKEIQQRKEREAERLRAKEEEKKRIEEKRLREEKLRKERAEKLAQEQAEKAERLLMSKEEKLMMTLLNRGTGDSKSKAKAAPAAKAKETSKEKAERETQRQAEKERQKAEREREKERIKAEKEAKLRQEEEAKEVELQRQREFAAEMEKAAAKLREAEREKELERERVRIENERIIAEREKARQERDKAEAKKPKSTEGKEGPASGAAAKPSAKETAAEKRSKKGTTALPVEFPSLPGSKASSASSGAGLQSGSGGAAGASAASSAAAGTPTLASSASSAALGPVDARTGQPMKILFKPSSAVRSTSTPTTTTKWTALLASDEPSSAPAPPKLASTPAKNPQPVEDFPPLNDFAPPPTPPPVAAAAAIPSSGLTAAAIVAQGISATQSASSQSAAATPQRSPQLKPAEEAAGLSTFSSSGIKDFFFPMRSSSEPVGLTIPSSGDVKAKYSPHLPPQMPALAAAYPVSGLADLMGSWDNMPPAGAATIGGGSTADISGAAGSFSTLPPPGILPSSPRLDPKDDGIIPPANSFYNLGSSAPSLNLSSCLLGDSNSDLMSLLKQDNTPVSVSGGYQPFGLSRGVSASLDSSIVGLGSSLSHGLELEGHGSAAHPPGHIGRPPSLTSLSGFSDPSSSGFLGGLGGLGLGLDMDDGRNSSRLSHLFGGSSDKMGGADRLGGEPFALGSFPSLGGDGSSSLGLFGLDGGSTNANSNNTSAGNTGGSSGTNNLGSRENGSPSAFNRSGLFGDSEGQSSRLDKILGGLGGSGFMMDSSPNRGSGSFMLSDSAGLLGNSSLNSSFWGSSLDSSAGGLLGGTSGFSNLSSLLSSSSTSSRRDLNDLGRQPEDELLSEASFPVVSWLRVLGVALFRWAMHGSEWAEYGMTLPRAVLALMPDPAGLFAEIARISGCDVKLLDLVIKGQQEKAAIFVRGTVGSMSNRAMDHALELFNGFMSKHSATPGLIHQAQALANASTPTSSMLAGVTSQGLPLVSPLPPAVGGSTSQSRWGGASLNVFEAGKGAPAAQDALADSMVEALISSSGALSGLEQKPALSSPTVSSTAASTTTPATATTTSGGGAVPGVKIAERPPLLKLPPHPSGQVRRYLEIPAELIGLVIGAGGKKIKELSIESGCRVQFKTSKASEKEGKPGVLELQGTSENMDRALNMVWELVQSVGREYREVTSQQARR